MTIRGVHEHKLKRFRVLAVRTRDPPIHDVITSLALSTVHRIGPLRMIPPLGMSWSRRTNSVTMPKLAPFPRMPQKSSGSVARHADDLPRCGDHLVADDAVDNRPEPTAQVAQAASQSDTRESGVGDRAGDTYQVVEGSLMIDVAPIGTRLDKSQLLVGSTRTAVIRMRSITTASLAIP